LKKSIEKVTGKTVKVQTTTDYNVAIQAIASGKAQLAYMVVNQFMTGMWFRLVEMKVMFQFVESTTMIMIKDLTSLFLFVII